MKEPVLNRSDRDSACWQKLKKHLEANLQKMREANDAHMDEHKRARLGGQIQCIKTILALDSDGLPLVEEFADLFKD